LTLANPFRALAARRSVASIANAAGDLKLSYAQFEELETFARFGARLDEDTPQDQSNMDSASAPVSSKPSSPPCPCPKQNRDAL